MNTPEADGGTRTFPLTMDQFFTDVIKQAFGRKCGKRSGMRLVIHTQANGAYEFWSEWRKAKRWVRKGMVRYVP